MKLLNVVLLILIVTNIQSQPDFPPCIAFDSIGKDTIKVLNSYSNSLYAGIDNEVVINKKYVPFKNIIVECAMGMVMEDDSNYIIIPAKAGQTLISVYQYDSGDTVLCIKKYMNVKRVPAPYITLDRIKLTDYDYISRELLLNLKYFEVHLSEDLVDDNWYTIKSLVFGYPVGQHYISKSCDGTILCNEILEDIKKIPAGTEVTLIFTISSSGDIFKRLSPIKIKIY